MRSNRVFVPGPSVGAAAALLVLFSAPAGAGDRVASGVSEPFRDVVLSAKVPGTVSIIARKEGEFVKAGDVLIEMDSAAEALEAERRRVVAESRAELMAASNRVETLRVDFETTRGLYERTKSISREEMQKKELELKLAEAELDSIKTSEERERIEYEMAVAKLAERKITAPFDGIIAKIGPEVGENCNAQQPIVRLVDNRQCRFVAHVEAGSGWRLKVGMKVIISLNDGPEPTECEGSVYYVSPVVDPSSGLQEVKVLFDNPDGSIRAGVTGALRLAE